MDRALFFVASAVAFEEYRLHLKSVSCPHCHAVGNLNRHGFLRGFGEKGLQREIRGWRVFCSNRGRRRGCGRTHSVFLADCLPGRMVGADLLWRFLEGLGSGLCVKRAWEKLATLFSLKCGYRILRAFLGSQSTLRSFLNRIQSPPILRVSGPLQQTVAHLRAVFPEDVSPVAAFHLYFQQPFLG